MIKLENVRKSYGVKDNQTEVLKGVSLDIEDGDFAVILGPSGSGKSTLLNVASGLERPDSGKVLYNRENIAVLSDKQLTEFRRKNIGFIFQQYYLLPNLNVDKNVKMGAELASNGNYAEAINALGLSEKRNKFPHELSGGEQQRIVIARALLNKPKLILADEPTGNLDPQTGYQIVSLLHKLADEGRTIIMATHNMQMVEDFPARVLRCNDKELIG